VQFQIVKKEKFTTRNGVSKATTDQTGRL